MKKILSILLAALCALLPTLALAQESTTITTTVPSAHTITIVCGEHGKAVIDGKTYSGTFTVQAARLGTLTIEAKPDSGYDLSQIWADDLDGVTVKGRRAVLSGIHCENTITLAFCKLSDEAVSSSAANHEKQTDASGSVLGKTTLADSVTLSRISGTGNALYDNVIGTGSGLGQLSIVFDGEDWPQDYELLNVKPDSEEQKNTVLVRAYPEENGDAAYRRLILSVTQLIRLVQNQQTEQLIFENGEAAVTVELADLLGGNVRKLIGLIVKGSETVSAETLNRDWSEVQAIPLTETELAAVKMEIRIIPMERADGSIAYDVSIWLCREDQEVEISSILPSLCVSLKTDGEKREQYAVGCQAEKEEDFQLLKSTLTQIPEELPENQPDEAEKFIVTMPEEEDDSPVTVYDADAPLSKERYSAMTAGYAKKGCYQLLKIEE